MEGKVKMEIWKLQKMSLVAGICLFIAACGGSSDSGSGARGKLSVSITDAPIYDAQSVEVDFTGIEVKTANGSALTFNFCEALTEPDVNPPLVQQGECTDSNPSIQTIDLLAQTGGASFLLLDQIDLPAGKVNWVRLALTDPAGRIVMSTGEHVLTVPSGNQTGLKLNRGFEVPADGEAHIYIDFDVRKSIVEMHSGMTTSYKLKPTLRMVEKFGAIAGNVDPLLRPSTCLGPSIYVFAGATTTPDDIERDQGDPVTSAMVDIDTGNYRADFLEPGDYTLAFVCADGVSVDGINFTAPPDDPDENDMLTFTLPTLSPATVVDGMTFVADFVAEI
jgi:hypothetical protein